MDRDDLELFRRSVAQATAAHTGTELDRALADLGWQDALAGEPRAAVSILFELQGASNVSSSALARVLGSDVLPALGRREPPARLEGERLEVDGLAVGSPDPAGVALVVATAGDKDVAVEVPVRALEVVPVSGLDPELGLARITGAVDLATEPSPVQGWSAAVAMGQLAIGHELVGASRTMLALAREHALERIQFGRPISSFQAVRHRLAEALVAIEAADAMLDGAWQEGSPQSAAMAKALAGRGARTVARHCQQVLAGIGFTTEHPLHRSVRRVLVLDELLASARTLTKELGEELVRTRRLPPILPL